MVKLPCTSCLSLRRPGTVLNSKVKFIKPRPGTNIPREIINGLFSHPNKIILVDAQNGEELTGHDVWLETGRIASGLIRSEIQMLVNEPVLFMTDHSIREKLFMIATLYTGATIMATEASIGFVHVLTSCRSTKPQVIVTNNEYFEFAIRLRKEVDGMEGARIILLERNSENIYDQFDGKEQNLHLAQDLFEWRELEEQLILRRVNRKIKARSHHSMLLTASGTSTSSSDSSKIISLSHERQLCDIWSLISATRRAPKSSSDPLVPLTDDDVLAGTLPLDQGTGTIALLWSLMVGCKYVLINTDDEVQFWSSVERFKITAMIGNSMFTYKLLKKLILWMDHPLKDPIDICSMRYIACTGSRVNIGPLMEILRPTHPNLNVTQFYANNEAGFVTMLSCEDAKESFESIGNLFPGVRGKVVDVKSGASLGPNEEGELLIKSPSLFTQYIAQPGVNVEDLMKDQFDALRFYRTGDLVHYDSDQKFYLNSRIEHKLHLDLDDCKISPEEIENVLNKHPMVDSSSVIGVPNSDLEGCVIPRAFIKMKTIEELEKLPNTADYNKIRDLIKRMKSGRFEQIRDDIMDFSSKELDERKQLKGGIIIIDDFPMIGGKLDRKKLTQI